MTEQSVAADMVRVEIHDGVMGEVQDAHVGVAGIADDGTSATIVVAGSGGGTTWEIRFDVRPGEIVPVGGRLAKIEAVTPSRDKARGAVAFSPVDGSAGTIAPDHVIVPAGARLRLDGPSVLQATDLTVEGWQPDERQPSAVNAAWHPARYPNDASEVTRQKLTVGGVAMIGQNHVTVLAIEGASERGPARMTLRLSHRQRSG